MTPLPLSLYPAPAAPTPAPSQIRFPRLPGDIRRRRLPVPGADQAQLVLGAPQSRAINLEQVGRAVAQSPSRLH